MRWGKLEISGGFLLVVALCNYLDHQGMILLALLSCVLHELGHYFAMIRLGGRLRRIRLSAVGAEMIIDGDLSYGKELVVALAGPFCNLAVALFSCQWVSLECFAGLNLALACFNLLPVARLDGGRILHCILASVFGEGCATEIGRIFDYIFSGIVVLLGAISIWFGGGFTLFLIGIWLCIGEKGEKVLVI